MHAFLNRYGHCWKFNHWSAHMDNWQNMEEGESIIVKERVRLNTVCQIDAYMYMWCGIVVAAKPEEVVDRNENVFLIFCAQNGWVLVFFFRHDGWSPDIDKVRSKPLVLRYRPTFFTRTRRQIKKVTRKCEHVRCKSNAKGLLMPKTD